MEWSPPVLHSRRDSHDRFVIGGERSALPSTSPLGKEFPVAFPDLPLPPPPNFTAPSRPNTSVPVSISTQTLDFPPPPTHSAPSPPPREMAPRPHSTSANQLDLPNIQPKSDLDAKSAKQSRSCASSPNLPPSRPTTAAPALPLDLHWTEKRNSTPNSINQYSPVGERNTRVFHSSPDVVKPPPRPSVRPPPRPSSLPPS